MPYLYFYSRGQEMLHLTLTDEPLVIGSKHGNYVIPDPGIAPLQCEIAKEGERFRLIDLSGKQTQVGGVLADSVLLEDGVDIRLGQFSVLFHVSLQERGGEDDESSRETLVDAFAQPTLPKALWLCAHPLGGGALVRAGFSEKALIGSRDGCALKLDGATVSARHAEVSREDGVLRLRDQGSTNGTWLGAVRVADIELPLGTRFRAGDWDVWVSGPEESKADGAVPVMTASGLVTADPGMLALLQQVDIIAKSDCPVLILGETGTGKELFAQAIHERSRRAAQKFIAFNCGLGRSPENFATQLFGHVKGAFTGADKAEPGTLATADGGTVFFDELKELPLLVQPNLLRAIAEGEIHPSGAPEPTHVDVRYVCATCHDLGQAVRDGVFRDDLYFRIAMIVLTLPPLRKRKGDILILWDHFVQKLWGGSKGMQLTDAAREKLLAHPWPGNVRELWHVVNRVLLFTHATVCDASDINFAPNLTAAAVADPPDRAETSPAPVSDSLVETKDKEWAHIEAGALAAVMRASKGNRTRACRQLAIDRKRLLRMLEEYKLEGVGLEDGEAGE